MEVSLATAAAHIVLIDADCGTMKFQAQRCTATVCRLTLVHTRPPLFIPIQGALPSRKERPAKAEMHSATDLDLLDSIVCHIQLLQFQALELIERPQG